LQCLAIGSFQYERRQFLMLLWRIPELPVRELELGVRIVAPRALQQNYLLQSASGTF